MNHVMPTPDDLLPGARVLARYGVSAMTLLRWQKRPELCFPKPIRINNRRYWRLSALQAFEARQMTRDGFDVSTHSIQCGE